MEAEVVVLSLDEGSSEGTYSFACPTCRERISKPADKNIVALLLSAGVRVREAAAPELDVTEERPGGAGFTLDDVIDFHFELEQPGWFETLLDPATAP